MHRTELDTFAGMWKFRSAVSRDQLVAIAEDWKLASPDNYVELYVRAWNSNPDRFAICFRYQRLGGPDMRKYIHHTSDLLRRTFGNELVGWDISEPITVIF